MGRINIKFNDSLNKLLKKDKRDCELSLELKLRQSVKDLIEAQGIPHTEVGMIVIDGKREEFLYQNYYSNEEIVERALTEGRVILTRDRGILKRRVVRYGYLIKSNDSKEQLREIFLNFDLLPEIKPFLRCISCNGIVERVDKKEIIEELEPLTRKYYNEFFRCTMCKKIYWKGGHRERVEEFVDDFLNKFFCSLGNYKKNGSMEKYNKGDLWKN